MMKVRVLPDDIEFEVQEGANLLEALTEGGVALDASCGGIGVCGQCRVRLVEGELASEPGSRQDAEDYEAGWRQACRSEVKSDVTIEIPAESRIEQEVVFERKPAPSGQYLTQEQIEALNPGWAFDPPLKKIYLELPPPTPEDNVADMARISRALRLEHGIEHMRVDPLALRGLPETLREADWKVTLTMIQARASEAFLDKGEKVPILPTLIRVEQGDSRSRHFALAIDVGTTTVSGQVMDLFARRECCTLNEYNSQVQYGADVITRMVYAMKPGGLETMQARAAESINRVIKKMSHTCGVSPQEISHISAAGNTAMTHLLLALNPKWLRESPYVPVTYAVGNVRAKELGIHIGDHARLYTFPSIASYVGGDIVAGVIATGIYKRSVMSLLIDIGTNGEIVIGNSDFMLAASCSAGPAFEGGGITCGMHAGSGAIERFRLDPLSYQVAFDTIRHAPARGICGSGLINAAASLVEAGIIEPNGRINLAAGSPITRRGPNGPEIVIAPADKTEAGADLVLAESDLDNLLRAKAAMYAGYSTLLDHVGMSFDDIEDVFLAGNFGNTLDIENAVTIGLLPDIDREKFKFVGNTSLRGASLVNQSAELLYDAELAARMITNVEFWDNPMFMEHYMASMFFPHTDLARFPSVSDRMEKIGKQRKNAL